MIYLMLQKSPLVYYILNSDTDYIGAMHNGKPSILHTECIASAGDGVVCRSLIHCVAHSLGI